MSKSNAISAFGTKLKIGDGATPTEAFTEICELTSIGGPSLALDTADVTHHCSTDAYREFVATLKDAGEVSIEGNFVPNQATIDPSTGILKDYKDRTLRNFQLIFPDGATTTWSFAAFVTAFEVTAAVDGVLTFSGTLKLSAAPTLA